ncbi:hypothetical protein [Sutcliffiella rhizosphaerae]|uniref:Uncharacterized protein n=1 Tax=Sutcliffiella rhizosphaerae TaxID=2880967 RepID=A0ABN8A956_9BACI|nr:hypothetical protein [Sutcliffiella rhizosphaerae]CAG9621665.1 hypothetical protein BACCIP111883_02438 [Sutcliffiella rhizosphaerae]
MREFEKELTAEPKIFARPTSATSNQQEFRKNFLKTILEEQKEINRAITSSFEKIHDNFEVNKQVQENYYIDLLKKLQTQDSKSDELKENIIINEKANMELGLKIEKLKVYINEQIHLELKERLSKLERLFEEEKLINQATIDQLAHQEDLTRTIISRLEKSESLYEDIHATLSQQESLHKQINEKLDVQEMFHKTVMQRLDTQDKMSQKLTEQLEILKKTILERLEATISSIEWRYKQTLQYFGGIFGLKDRVIQKQQTLPEQQELEEEKVEVEIK